MDFCFIPSGTVNHLKEYFGRLRCIFIGLNEVNINVFAEDKIQNSHFLAITILAKLNIHVVSHDFLLDGKFCFKRILKYESADF